MFVLFSFLLLLLLLLFVRFRCERLQVLRCIQMGLWCKYKIHPHEEHVFPNPILFFIDPMNCKRFSHHHRKKKLLSNCEGCCQKKKKELICPLLSLGLLFCSCFEKKNTLAGQSNYLLCCCGGKKKTKVNLFGVLHGQHAFVPLMIEQAKKGHGNVCHIVNTASIAAILPGGGFYF